MILLAFQSDENVRIFPQKTRPLDVVKRKNERKTTMQVPENYGAVVLAIGAMQIPNYVATVQVLQARKKYKVKYPNLYAPEVGSLRCVVRCARRRREFSPPGHSRVTRRARVLSLFLSFSLSLSLSLFLSSLADVHSHAHVLSIFQFAKYPYP